MDINWSNWKKNNYLDLEKSEFLIDTYKNFFKFHKINTKKNEYNRNGGWTWKNDISIYKFF